MIRRRSIAFAVALSLAASVGGVVAAAGPAAADTPALLGGMSVADYCFNLGYQGTTAVGPATQVTGTITGPNAAYDNWACVANSGATTLIKVGGPAPSFTNLCAVQYPGVASYPAPTNADDAYTWNCYLLPPASGPGVRAQVQAATTAVFQNSLVQDEIAQLKSLVAARKVGLAIVTGVRFLGSRPLQELIGDVLAAYRLPNQAPAVTAGLAAAIVWAVLS
ncbi:MAG: hypothetical protein JWN46_3806 [Acidimicrobiales bacterium]|nr:hypothetical protein [Acidimicrobiales bacterium]